MAKPVFLHIGMPKTGTSSIQQYLRNNRVALRGHDFIVPTTLGHLNHENVSLFALADRSRSTVRRRHGLMSVEAVHAFRNALMVDWTNELAKWSPHEAVVVTGEHMSLLQEPDEFVRLKQFLGLLGDRPVRVIVYLRRQDLYCLSGYSQRIKGGSRLQWSELEKEIDRQEFDYETMLRRWKEAFGKESIVVRPFEAAQWANGDLICDFMSIIGCPIGPEFRSAVRKNVSLDARSLEFLRRLNHWYPQFVKGRLNPQRQPLVSAMQRIAGGVPARMKHEVALAFQERYRESNARIAREYLGRADGRLFFIDPEDEAEQAPALEIDDAIEITAKLWALAQQTAPPSGRDDRKTEEAPHSGDEGWL